MIDLLPTIRKYILNDATFCNYLSDYKNTKAVFIRRPIPTDISYPVCLISPIVSDIQNDFVSCSQRRIITHDIFVYSTNDTDAEYHKVSDAAFRLGTLLHRAPKHLFEMPAGSSLVEVTCISPMPAPTDDFVKVARVVSVNFDITIGE